MKKILLTGVILILLILLAVDFYVVNKRNNDRNNSAVTITSGNSATGAGSTAAQVNSDESAIMNGDNGNVTTTIATTTTSTRRHTTTTRTVKSSDKTLAVNVPQKDGGMYVILDGSKDEPVAVEVSQDFTGNMPKEKNLVMKQAKTRKVHFGIEGGLQQSCFDNDGSSKKMEVGYHAGVLADVAIGNHFSVQPGVRYSLKGIGLHNITSNGGRDMDTRSRINLNYVEVPVNFVIMFGDKEDARVMIGAGPYAAYLVSARDQYETTTTNYNTNPAARTTASGDGQGSVTVTQGSRSVAISNDKNRVGTSMTDAGSMRPFDWGVGGFVGVQAPGGLFIKAGAQRGLSNIRNNGDGTTSANNCNYFVSLGYLIGYKN